MKNTPLLLTFILLSSMLSSHAGTLSYWRFENTPGFLNDSSGNGRTLTVTSPGEVSQASIPGSGNGSDFQNPVPQTAESNAGLASFSINDGSSLTAADNDAFTDTSFSVEGYFNLAAGSDDSEQKVLISHFNNVGDQRSWAFYVDGSNLNLVLNDSGVSSGNEFLDSGFDIAENIDYYLGFTVDLGLGNSSEVTFYLQDLTNGGALQNSNFASNKTSLHNSTSDLYIGDFANENQDAWFTGFADEIRLSDTKLEQSELLVIPEPSTMILMGISLAGYFLFRRRD